MRISDWSSDVCSSDLSLPPIRHEPTTRTGIRHLDATLSMARPDRANSAMGNFFITVGPTPNMDARGDYIGYAAFGHVVAGRSEECSVGKEWISTWRSRWGPYL